MRGPIIGFIVGVLSSICGYVLYHRYRARADIRAGLSDGGDDNTPTSIIERADRRLEEGQQAAGEGTEAAQAVRDIISRVRGRGDGSSDTESDEVTT